MTEQSPLEMAKQEQDEGLPLNSFNITLQQGRFDFLWRLSEIGEEGLLQATAHIWACLAPPEDYRATKMALAAKVPGTGKVGLLNVLKRFLIDFERETDPPPLPQLADFKTAAAWHEAVSDHFEAGEMAIVTVIERYSAIINGEKPPKPPRPAKVLKGPWQNPRRLSKISGSDHRTKE